MRLLIDTNVFADQVCTRTPFDREANKIFSMAYTGLIDLLILPTSYATCSYIGERLKIAPETIRLAYSNILSHSTLATTDKSTMSKAIMLGWKDFEDAMQYCTALKYKADAIITRNKKDFALSTIPIYTPSEFIDEMVEVEY